MPLRRLDPREIDDLCDVVEGRILEKIRENIKSEMVLMNSNMIDKIVSALGGIPRHVSVEDSYEEIVEDFEVVGSSGRSNRVERPRGGRTNHFLRLGSQLKLQYKTEVSNFSCTLNPKDLIDWIGELKDYFELEEIKEPLKVRLAQTNLKGNASSWWKEL